MEQKMARRALSKHDSIKIKLEIKQLIFVLEFCYRLFYSLNKVHYYVRNCRKSKKNYRR